MSDLKSHVHTKELRRYYMDELTVDGIEYKNPNRHFSMFMVDIKDEFDEDDHPSDTGGFSFRWVPGIEISEKHWLVCNRLVSIGDECHRCGEVANENG